MKLSNCEILPGVVTVAKDPKCLGRIKATIAGKTNPDTMSDEDLPWIAPFVSFGYQRISKPMEGQKVWILHDNTNYYEYYWLPAWEVNSNTEGETTLQDYDIIVSRPGDGFGSQSFYSGDTGFVTRIGNNASTTMKMNGDIENVSGKAEVSIRGNKTYIGQKDTDYEPMVLGTQLVQLLRNLQQGFTALHTSAMSFWTTEALAPSIDQCSRAIGDLIDKITSETSHVSK